VIHTFKRSIVIITFTSCTQPTDSLFCTVQEDYVDVDVEEAKCMKYVSMSVSSTVCPKMS